VSPLSPKITLGRSGKMAELSVNRHSCQFLLCGFGNPEVDHFGHWPTVLKSDQDFGWLDVPVDDSFLMRVLDGIADRDEQFQALGDVEID